MDSVILSILLYILIIPLISSSVFFFLFSRLSKEKKYNEKITFIGICICFFSLSLLLIEKDLSLNILQSNIKNILVMLSLILVYLLVIIIYVKIFNKQYLRTLKKTITLPLISISIYAGLVFSYSPVEIGLMRGIMLSLLILLVFYVYKIYNTISAIKDEKNKV